MRPLPIHGHCPASSVPYGPLRLPLRSRPFHGDAAYRARRSQATRELAPHGSYCWGGDGSLLFPRWLCQRSTPSTPPGSSGLHSKLFTPSMAFASTGQARLPVGPLRVVIHDAAGFASCCGPLACTLPKRARPRAPTPRSPRTPAGYYKGDLVPPLAGLAPASHRELAGHAGRQKRTTHVAPRWRPTRL